MNRTRIALVVFTFALFTAFASAASAMPSVGTLEFSGSYAKSSQDVTGNNESLGGGLGLGAAYWRSLAPTTSWGIEASIDNLGHMDVTDPITGTTVKVSEHVFGVTPEFRVNFGAPVGPSFFAQGGVGYYNVSASTDISGVSISASEGKVGFNLGAGVGFPVGPKTKMNFQGNYHSISTSGASTNYLGIRAGLGFSL